MQQPGNGFWSHCNDRVCMCGVGGIVWLQVPWSLRVKAGLRNVVGLFFGKRIPFPVETAMLDLRNSTDTQ